MLNLERNIIYLSTTYVKFVLLAHSVFLKNEGKRTYPNSDSTTQIRKAYREMYVDRSHDTVDLVRTGRKSLVLTKAPLSILISRSREIETIDSIIILPFPSSMRISNQSILNRNYIENEDLVSTVDFHVQSTVSWERSNLDSESNARCGTVLLQ